MVAVMIHVIQMCAPMLLPIRSFSNANQNLLEKRKACANAKICHNERIFNGMHAVQQFHAECAVCGFSGVKV